MFYLSSFSSGEESSFAWEQLAKLCVWHIKCFHLPVLWFLTFTECHVRNSHLCRPLFCTGSWRWGNTPGPPATPTNTQTHVYFNESHQSIGHITICLHTQSLLQTLCLLQPPVKKETVLKMCRNAITCLIYVCVYQLPPSSFRWWKELYEFGFGCEYTSLV